MCFKMLLTCDCEFSQYNVLLFFVQLQNLMIEFFNAKMQEAKLNTAPGNPVIAAQINLEQNFAFIEVCIMENLHVISTMK